jgi:membrane-bound ClpP family serine protease
LWTARAEAPIAAGVHVRVVEREGLVLTVETDSASTESGHAGGEVGK